MLRTFLNQPLPIYLNKSSAKRQETNTITFPTSIITQLKQLQNCLSVLTLTQSQRIHPTMLIIQLSIFLSLFAMQKASIHMTTYLILNSNI